MVRAAIFALALWLAAPPVTADERADTEARLAQVQGEIEALQRSLETDRGALSRERSALKDLDLEIQATVRTLSEVDSDLRAQQGEVDRSRAEQDAYLDQLQAREGALGEQIRAAWTLNRDSRLKLILNQDDPARLGRLLAYYDILGQSQADRIRELHAALRRLETLQEQLDRELVALGDIQDEHEQRRNELETQRQTRSTLIAELEGTLASDEARVEELQRNRRDLETLLDRLGDALADIPADLGSRGHPVQLRGELPMPVRGRVLEAYGRPRTAGLTWQGWLIEAPAGQAVEAVAYGRVAYADWLRGYGLLLIVDHGDGFMSLYGHNESLRADVGDWVGPGEVISSVGLGLDSREGLYFELRRKGKAVDPAAWIRR